MDDICLEFDYPEDISNRIPYMPSNDNGTIAENRMEYIEDGKNKWYDKYYENKR